MKPDDEEARIRRQHALREWHLNPLKYQREFSWHVERGDFDHVLKPPAPAKDRGAA